MLNYVVVTQIILEALENGVEQKKKRISPTEISSKDLGELCGTSQRTVTTQLNELRDLGIINVHIKYMGRGGIVYRYTLTPRGKDVLTHLQALTVAVGITIPKGKW